MSKKSKEEQLSEYESRMGDLLESERQAKVEYERTRCQALERDEFLPRFVRTAEVAHELAQLRSKIYYLKNSEKCLKNARLHRIKRKIELIDKE